MNKQITSEEFERIRPKTLCIMSAGSRLYKTEKADSDFDKVMVVSEESGLKDDQTYQYTSKEENTDYLICTPKRLQQARIDGSDMVLYETEAGKANYRIIKAYLGLAKRDLREFVKGNGENKKKKYHACRCFLIAQNLMADDYPNLIGAAHMAYRYADAITHKTLEMLIEEKRKLLNKWLDQQIIDP